MTDLNPDNAEVAALFADGTETFTVPDQALTPGTYLYALVAVSPYGVFSEIGPALEVVVQDDDSVDPPVGNEPTGLAVTAIAGGVLQVRWHYSEAGQPAEPTGFKIYSVSDDPTPVWTLLATLASRGGRAYSWDSATLAHETELAICVRAYKTYTYGTGEEAYDVDYETANTATVAATADAEGPPAITGLTAELVT